MICLINSKAYRCNLTKNFIIIDTSLLVSIFRDKDLVDNTTHRKRALRLVAKLGLRR